MSRHARPHHKEAVREFGLGLALGFPQFRFPCAAAPWLESTPLAAPDKHSPDSTSLCTLACRSGSALPPSDRCLHGPLPLRRGIDYSRSKTADPRLIV